MSEIKWKKINRPIPEKNKHGDILPPLCLDIVPPKIAVRVLEVEETEDLLGRSTLWVPNKGEGMQQVLQIIALPKDTSILPMNFKDIEIGDLVITAGRGFCVPTNWKYVEVFLVDPTIIVSFLREPAGEDE